MTRKSGAGALEASTPAQRVTLRISTHIAAPSHTLILAAERLADLDQRVSQIERRLAEIQDELARIARSTVSPCPRHHAPGD